MGNREIEQYVEGLNRMHKEYGLLVESDTNLYEVNEPSGRNKVVAEIKWDNEAKEYYARYVH